MSLSRRLFLSGLGVVYLIAFVSLWFQLDGLIGPEGIAPLERHLLRISAVVQANPVTGNPIADRLLSLPTLLWFLDPATGPHLVAGLGCAASIVVFSGRFQAPALLLCWASYLSLALGGQQFLSFQWDTLLIELGFASIFVAPWGRRATSQAPRSAWFLLRWILFRLIFFGGLVKLTSGDPTWRDLTALSYHYETQPLPNPASWWAHGLPLVAHQVSTAITFVIELVLAWFIMGPRGLRPLAFFSIIVLMGLLASTGNYGFFQLLTMILALSLLDDDHWRGLLPKRFSPPPPLPPPGRLQVPVVLLITSVLFSLSIMGIPGRYFGMRMVPQVERALTMAAPFRTINHYGLFARMTTTRPIPVLEAQWDDGPWTELTWRFQTSDPAAAPPIVAPYMPRLDWQLWFAGLSNCNRNRWVFDMQKRVLEGSEPVVALIGDLRLKQRPPTAVRTVLYEYRFVEEGSEEAERGLWWTREAKGEYCPTVR